MSALSKKPGRGTSLVVQGLGIHLAMQGTWVQSLVGELSSRMSKLSLCVAITELMTATREPVGHNERSHVRQ